jgi:hypothetical protein
MNTLQKSVIIMQQSSVHFEEGRERGCGQSDTRHAAHCWARRANAVGECLSRCLQGVQRYFTLTFSTWTLLSFDRTPTFSAVGWWATLLVLATTFMPLLRHDTYYAPLSTMAWFLATGAITPLFQLLDWRFTGLLQQRNVNERRNTTVLGSAVAYQRRRVRRTAVSSQATRFSSHVTCG